MGYIVKLAKYFVIAPKQLKIHHLSTFEYKFNDLPMCPLKTKLWQKNLFFATTVEKWVYLLQKLTSSMDKLKASEIDALRFHPTIEALLRNLVSHENNPLKSVGGRL